MWITYYVYMDMAREMIYFITVCIVINSNAKIVMDMWTTKL